jgi:hypothetical protein
MGCSGTAGTSDSELETLTVPADFCAETCAAPAADGCFTTEACTADCLARAGDWPAELQEAFAGCVAENPLCFETMDNCMLNELHPAGGIHPVQLEGSGFDNQEGLVIHVWHDPDLPAQFGGEAVIAQGAFSFAWEEAVYVSDTTTSLLLFFIDVDGDQRCSAANDLTGTASPAWNGDFLDPAFAASVAPPLTEAPFVCDFLP